MTLQGLFGDLVLNLVEQHLHPALHHRLSVSRLLAQDLTAFDLSFLEIVEFLRLFVLLLLEGFSALLLFLLHDLVFQFLRIHHEVDGFLSFSMRLSFLLSLELCLVLNVGLLCSTRIRSSLLRIHLSIRRLWLHCAKFGCLDITTWVCLQI